WTNQTTRKRLGQEVVWRTRAEEVGHGGVDDAAAEIRYRRGDHSRHDDGERLTGVRVRGRSGRRRQSETLKRHAKGTRCTGSRDRERHGFRRVGGIASRETAEVLNL